MSMCMPTCVHATHALLMAHALYALPHTIRVRGTCAYVVGALRSSAKRLPKFEGLLAFVDGSNAERSARGLQYAAVYSTRYICVLILVICVLILLAFVDGSDEEGNARGLETYCYETFRGLQ